MHQKVTVAYNYKRNLLPSFMKVVMREVGAKNDKEGMIKPLKEWQRDHGLYPNGCLDRETCSKLASSSGIPFREPESRSMLVVDGKLAPASKWGVPIRNYLQDGEIKFKTRARRRPPTHIVFSESETLSSAEAEALMDFTGRGSHFLIYGGGDIVQHGDPGKDTFKLSGPIDDYAVHITTVNPLKSMRGQYVPPPWDAYRSEEERWWKVWRGQYVSPTREQMISLEMLVDFLLNKFPSIKSEFPSSYLSQYLSKMGGYRDGAIPEPGFLARRDLYRSHDGRYILEHMARKLTGKDLTEAA